MYASVLVLLLAWASMTGLELDNCIIALARTLQAVFHLVYSLQSTKGVNIREQGSKNIGATNVGRVLGKNYGVICFALDVLERVQCLYLCRWNFVLQAYLGKPIDDNNNIRNVAYGFVLHWLLCLVTCIHHGLKFGGGKGVATTFGGMVAMWPLLNYSGSYLRSWLGLSPLKGSKMISSCESRCCYCIYLVMQPLTVFLDSSTVEHAWPLLAVTDVHCC